MKLSHIGIAVKNIEDKLKVWQGLLALELKDIKEVPDQKVKVAVLSLGNIDIELLEPIGEESTIHKFIEKRGEGLHHLCFEIDDIDNVLAEMRKGGAQLIDEVPRIGVGGKKIVFIHPKSTGGVLIELTQ